MLANRISAYIAIVLAIIAAIAIAVDAYYRLKLGLGPFVPSDLKADISIAALLAGAILLLRRRGNYLPAAWGWVLAQRFPNFWEAPPAVPAVLLAHRDPQFQESMRHGIESAFAFSQNLNLALALVALIGLVLSLYGEGRRWTARTT